MLPAVVDRRPLSGMERAWLSASELFPPFAIQLVVDYLGAAPASAALHAAVEALVRARPGVRLRLGGAWPWQRWQADGPGPLLAEGACSADACTPAALQEVAPLAPLSGPGLSVHLLREPAEGPWRLVLRGCHAHLDGRGLVAVLHDLLAALRGEALPPRPLGPPDQLLAREVLAAGSWPEGPPEPPPGGCRSPGGAVRGEPHGDLVHVHRRVSGRRRPLEAVARAVVAEAGAHGVSPGELRLGLPVDLRRHDPALATADGNLTGLCHLRGEAVASGVFSHELAARIAAGQHLRLVQRVAPARWLPGPLATWAARQALRRELGQDTPSTSLTLSNLGRLACRELDLPGSRCTGRHWLPPGSAGLPLFLGLVGDEEGLELGASCSGAWFDPATAEAFMDGVVARLEALA